ncbi:hypothetical protein SARC_09861 [Sphaeroforma arctica JP610]|uniref:Uncharacterized protein n=1 Tax=Sphaeroforma arctica JP610 TaxID=667725 RepID=A0A0L0FNY4_9EUKA|nr:hypothetical protein SARC_09861 [Sphaeroforma arctica JP610]KNC77683.1 hypothetical protein SARC_09861 [Sphaeroforma arctica JP610]|eukprot:XP_014151585.1 hypothetical protein SARC_09861 [Sphaeroforma arctica JP610]
MSGPLSEKRAYPEQYNQSMRYHPDANARNPVHWKYPAGGLSNTHSTKVERGRESTRHTGHPAVHHLTTGPQGEQHSRYLQRSALPRDQYHSNPDLSRQYKHRVADDHQQYSRYRDGDRGPLTPKRKASDLEELRLAKQPRSNPSSPHAEHYSYYSGTRALTARPQFSSHPDVQYRSTYGHGVEGSRDSTSAAQYRPMEGSRDSTSAAQHRPSEHISSHKAWSSSKRYSLDFQGLHQQPVAYQLARAEGGDLIEADVGLQRYNSIESTVEITHDVVSPDCDADHEPELQFNPSGRIPRDDVYTGSARSNRVVHEEPSSNLADRHMGPLYSHPRQQSVHARPISVHKEDDQNRVSQPMLMP